MEESEIPISKNKTPTTRGSEKVLAQVIYRVDLVQLLPNRDARNRLC